MDGLYNWTRERWLPTPGLELGLWVQRWQWAYRKGEMALEESRFKGHGSGARFVGVEVVTVLGRNAGDRRGRR